ncbi:hypothetical protein BDV96DRAFT_645526 [Lophiotrema nucula]|uniref:NACHT domain-containing protein n=1 Tax=Lophiotrema nucula TaxID=690887 RepID=A0A6A5Z9I7_9PLEO|nr:hypothetical protein BDV96DRAFT_645526 [Lophiotrema nucula]
MNPPTPSIGVSTPTRTQAAWFQHVLDKHKASLTDKERRQFQVATIEDLQVSIKAIQDQQESEKRLQAMGRLNVFLEGMKEYEKVVQVFVNTSEILAFVWVACTFAEAFNTLMEAYQRIGEHLPLLSQYEVLFRNEPQMARVLVMMYEDILSFHYKAMSYFKKKMWAKLFHALWKTFNTEFEAILHNLREHRSLIESQAGLLQYSAILRMRDEAQASMQKAEVAENRRRREFVYQWLSAAKYDVDQESCEKIRRQYPGTGDWLLKKDRFHSWFDPDFCANQLLWLNGIPGAGKTILASLVIEEAIKLKQTKHDIAVVFFYCRDQDNTRDTFISVARGLLTQLMQQDDSLLSYFYEIASRSGQTTLSSPVLAKEILDTATKNCEKLYIIIDGVDECEKEERKDLVSFLVSVWEALPIDEADSLRCMFISQDDSAARKDFSTMVALKITTNDVKHDIRSFARVWSLKIQSRFDLSDERLQYVEDVVTERADGMFLFAKLMSAYLYEQSSLGQLEEELIPGSFPKGPTRLNELYGRIMRRISTRKDTVKLLGWFVCSRRPLKWREIQCAVSIDLEEQTVDWKRKRIVFDPKDMFGSLVEVQADDTVKLVHYSAKRYLTDTKSVDTAAEELALTSLCAGYLTFPSFESKFEPDIGYYGFVDYIGYYGFVDYAYAYWSRHLEKALSTPKTAKEVQDLAETLGVFIDMHWDDLRSITPTPKSILVRLKALKDERNFEKIACAVHMARKLLHAPSGLLSPNERVLRLGDSVSRIRRLIEILRSEDEDWRKHEVAYGSDVYKCPRLNCNRFYNGFATCQLRDEHVQKHERSYFCSFPGCHMALLGCTTLKELQKHERDFHEALDFEDEADFPELPPEKVSFDCTQCDAKFTRKHNLKIHMRTHDAPNEKSFVCSICGKTFARQGDRTRHESTLHSGPKEFTCGGQLQNGAKWGCGRVFNRADVLNRHYRSEKGRACKLPLEEEESEMTLTSTPAESQ